MVLKTFSVSEEIFKEFSAFCKERGMSMSKQVEKFMALFAKEEPMPKKEYYDRLEKIRKEGKFIRIKNLDELFQ